MPTFVTNFVVFLSAMSVVDTNLLGIMSAFAAICLGLWYTPRGGQVQRLNRRIRTVDVSVTAESGLGNYLTWKTDDYASRLHSV